MLQAARIGDIIIRIKQAEGYSFGVLKGVVHVPNLGRNCSVHMLQLRRSYSCSIRILAANCLKMGR